jgi:hypothetical protein
MAGLSRCPYCEQPLVSVLVESVSTRGALPPHRKLFVVACFNCHRALGTPVVDMTPPAADKRAFHGASAAKPQRNSGRSVEQRLQRLLGDERAARRLGPG